MSITSKNIHMLFKNTLLLKNANWHRNLQQVNLLASGRSYLIVDENAVSAKLSKVKGNKIRYASILSTLSKPSSPVPYRLCQQVPLFSGFLLGLANGKYWQKNRG